MNGPKCAKTSHTTFILIFHYMRIKNFNDLFISPVKKSLPGSGNRAPGLGDLFAGSEKVGSR